MSPETTAHREALRIFFFRSIYTRGSHPGTWAEFADRLEKQRDEALRKLGRCRAILDEIIEQISVPEPDCRCHISPPCADCVDHGGMRELLTNAKELSKGGTP